MHGGFVPGAVFRVPVGHDDFAYGVMLSTFPFFAFYDKGTVFGDEGSSLDQPMFVLLVEKSAYSAGKWGRPVYHVPAEELPHIPRFFWQSPVNKFDCKIVDVTDNKIRRVRASPNECIGLEPEAIWASVHIESRIADTYAGQPNLFLESLRLKV